MAVSGTKGPTYSESGSCHSGTLGEIEKFKMAAKMAAANVKKLQNSYNFIIISPRDILFASRYRFWHSRNMMGYIGLSMVYILAQNKRTH